MKTGMKRNGMRGSWSVGVGMLSLLTLATPGLAQDNDAGWWEAEEVLAGQPEWKEAPQGRATLAREFNGRDRNRYDDDRYDDDRHADYRYEDDRYDDDRYRGRSGGIVIPGGRVRIRPRARARYSRHAYAYDRPLWRHVDWRVRFRDNGRYHYDRRRPRLRDIVGRRTVRRLEEHRNWIGARGRLTYRWVSLGRRGEVLQVRAGRYPIAEFVNFGRDNRVDIVRLAR